MYDNILSWIYLIPRKLCIRCQYEVSGLAQKTRLSVSTVKARFNQSPFTIKIILLFTVNQCGILKRTFTVRLINHRLPPTYYL